MPGTQVYTSPIHPVSGYTTMRWAVLVVPSTDKQLPWEEFPVLAGIKGGYLHIADLKGKLADAQQLKVSLDSSSVVHLTMAVARVPSA